MGHVLIQEVKVGIIGFGFIGKWYEKCFASMPAVTLGAVAEANDTAREEAAHGYGLKAYADYREMLRKEMLDAVVVATPPDTHFEIVRDALAAGTHIICEKPVAESYEQAQRIAQLVRASDKLVMINFMERFNQAVCEAKNYIDAGGIGDVIMVKGDSRLNRQKILGMSANAWHLDTAKGGGPVLEMLIHNFDLYRLFAGSEVRKVHAAGGLYFYNRFQELRGMVELDNVAVMCETESGAIGLFSGCYNAPSKGPMFEFSTEVTGCDGNMNLDFSGKPLAIYSEQDGVHFPEPLRQGIPGGSYYMAFMRYIDSIRQNRILDRVATIEDGLADQAICEAVLLSLREKKMVSLPF